MKTSLLAILAALAPFASMSQPAPDWRQHVTITDSRFEKNIKLEGRSATFGSLYGRPAKTTYLVTLVNKTTGTAEHILVFSDMYEGRGWRFWDAASTNSAQTLKVLKVQRDLPGRCYPDTGCLHHEVVGAELPESMLREAATGDVQIRFTGRGVAHSLRMDPIDAQMQLAATEAAVAQIKGPASSK